METYFSAWVRGKTVGDFLYSIQPEAPNAVVVGQYKRLELTERERWRWMAAMREDRRAGRLSNFDFDTAGSWDTWSSIPLRDAHGEPQPGSMPFEPRHYTLELVADQGGERMTGHTSIDLVAEDGPAPVARARAAPGPEGGGGPGRRGDAAGVRPERGPDRRLPRRTRRRG